MNRICTVLVLLISLLTAISSPLCAQDTLPSDEELISVLQSNLQAYNDKNIKAVMDTIDPNSPGYSQTEMLTNQVFQQYDLKFEIKSAKVIDKKIDEAQVRMVQITRKIKGPDFRDNETTSIQILKKINGKWKISDTKMEDVKYLDPPVGTMKDQG
ncbi:MAG: hypothetical protein AB2L14_13795 [Candidatus Xenobiia bacterium LiM19]